MNSFFSNECFFAIKLEAMRKGEIFEKEVAQTLVSAGLRTYRRPKTMWHSQDMFKGDVLFLTSAGNIAVIQCKKGNDFGTTVSRGRAAVRENVNAQGGAVRYYYALCAGRGHEKAVILYHKGSDEEVVKVANDLKRMMGSLFGIVTIEEVMMIRGYSG